MTPFLALIRKDLRVFFSDRRAVIMAVVAPIMIASFFGYLFGGSGNSEPSKVNVLAIDEDGSTLSREIVARISSDRLLDVKPSTASDARELVRTGKATVAFMIPSGFAVAAGGAFFSQAERPKIGILFDPSHRTEFSMFQGMLAAHIMESLGKQVFGGVAGRPGGLSLPYRVQAEEVTSGTGIKYSGYAHSFGGMGIQFILFVGIDVGIKLLLQRQSGVWKRLRAAPLSRAMLLGSRAASAALTSMFVLLLLFGFARAVFGVRIQGSMAGFLGVCAAFSLMTASYGLLIASLGKTPDATRGLSILATLMMVMLGGAWVPTFVFPQWMQKLTVVIPTRWAMDGLDAMTWRGLGFSAAAVPIGLLLFASAVFGTLAVARFRWEAEG
jgi:ABC-2 type transport system permease protein